MAHSPDDLVRVHIAPSPEEAAEVARSLADRGIACHMERVTGAADFLSSPAPSFEVSVRRRELSAARAILDRGAPEIVEWPSACEQCGYSLDGLKPPILCPECGWNAAEIAHRRSDATAPRDLDATRRRLFPWLTGWGLVAAGLGIFAAGAVILLTGPHDPLTTSTLWYAPRNRWTVYWHTSGLERPSASNVGAAAIVTLGVALAILGIRDLRRGR